MSTVAVVVIVIVVIAVLGVVGFVVRGQTRRRGLQQRFGPEYDRAVASHESTREAEQELLARKKRHDELEIRSLDPEVRERHLTEWRGVQERFVDEPESAVTEADRLLVTVMGERGYPTEGYEQQVSDLSVEHASTIDRYRQAHDISTQAEAKQATTEDLRQAMVHYRALFNELLDADDNAAGNGHRADRAAETTDEPVATRTETAAETRADRTDRTDAVAAEDEPVAGEPVAPESDAAERGLAERDAAEREGERRTPLAASRPRTGLPSAPRPRPAPGPGPAGGPHGATRTMKEHRNE